VGEGVVRRLVPDLAGVDERRRSGILEQGGEEQGDHARSTLYFIFTSKHSRTSWSRRYSLPFAITGCAHEGSLVRSGCSKRPCSTYFSGVASTRKTGPL